VKDAKEEDANEEKVGNENLDGDGELAENVGMGN
jgi:hypothetical protein